MQFDNIEKMDTLFLEMKAEFSACPNPRIKERVEVLQTLKSNLLAHQSSLIKAASNDFGYRCDFDTQFADILPTIAQINHIVAKLPSWSKSKSRPAGLLLFPSKVSVEYCPKGVVGVIAPWNFPIQLAVLPVATAIAAGNRVLLKLSEFTPTVNAVLKDIFQPLSDWCQVIEGGAEVAGKFTSLPFNHLFFTGSTAVGKKVMTAAALNLTPVTLELGGKSPVIVTEQACLDTAALAIVFGKMTNAGQICTSPDYVLAHQNVADVLQAKITDVYKTYFTAGCRSKDVSAIINQQQFLRLKSLLSDAKEKGAEVTSVFTNDVIDEEHKLGLHIVTGALDSMLVMQEEIFGPILPILTYDSQNEVFDSIAIRPEPLALYIFTDNKAEVITFSERIQSGGLSVNECILHVAAEHAPFGGVGRSGLGHYHDKEGFETFSHKRTKLESYGLRWRTKLMLKKPSWFVKSINWLFMR